MASSESPSKNPGGSSAGGIIDEILLKILLRKKYVLLGIQLLLSVFA
jgi:hypothetical protein